MTDKQIYKSLKEIQFEVNQEPIPKDTRARFKYLSLPKLIEIMVLPLHKHGCFIVDETKDDILTTSIVHEDGSSISTSISVAIMDKPKGMGDMQARGANETYGRRYNRLKLSNISPEDDDGESMRTQPKPPARPVKKANPGEWS